MFRSAVGVLTGAGHDVRTSDLQFRSGAGQAQFHRPNYFKQQIEEMRRQKNFRFRRQQRQRTALLAAYADRPKNIGHGFPIEVGIY